MESRFSRLLAARRQGFGVQFAAYHLLGRFLGRRYAVSSARSKSAYEQPNSQTVFFFLEIDLRKKTTLALALTYGHTNWYVSLFFSFAKPSHILSCGVRFRDVEQTMAVLYGRCVHIINPDHLVSIFSSQLACVLFSGGAISPGSQPVSHETSLLVKHSCVLTRPVVIPTACTENV